ncbi:MAG: hypothetical protein OXU51_04060 [Candidatus Poribacteria bacterium]|nr:hypothetical protein [Candidatus Poribacteria bacterium]
MALKMISKLHTNPKLRGSKFYQPLLKLRTSYFGNFTFKYLEKSRLSEICTNRKKTELSIAMPEIFLEPIQCASRNAFIHFAFYNHSKLLFLIVNVPKPKDLGL